MYVIILLSKKTIISLICRRHLYSLDKNYVCACMLSCVRLFVACQDPLFTELSWQEYWSGLPFPSPGNLLNPGIEPRSLVSLALQAEIFNKCLLNKNRMNKWAYKWAFFKALGSAGNCFRLNTETHWFPVFFFFFCHLFAHLWIKMEPGKWKPP